MKDEQNSALDGVFGCLAYIAFLSAFFAVVAYSVIHDKSHLKRWVVTQNGKTYVSKRHPSWHRFTYTVWTDEGQVILSSASGEIVVRETMEGEANQ